MENGGRRALLIGVGAHPGAAHRLSPLRAAVDVDLRVMSAALTGSGYVVEQLCDPTRNEIAERITALSDEASAGDTLLLYFTGHGIRVDGIDYLVPADARAPAHDGDERNSWKQPHVRESLLDADISKYLVHCRADTVLWLIDACREVGDGGAAAFASHVTTGPPHSGFAMMTGCAPGKRGGFTEHGSFFTLALARALDPLTEAATVEQVYQVARRETQSMARRAGAEPQLPLIRYGSDRETETRAREIARGRRLLEAWQEAVRTTALWNQVPKGDAATVTRFQGSLVSLAVSVARHVHHAQTRLPDPWADDEFPVRVLCDRLPALLPEGIELSSLEVTALIAGVLLHEAAWADRLSQAAELRPQRTRRVSGADDQRRHYEQVAEQHPQVAEKLDGWYWWESDPSDDRDAVMLWLVHQWIAERFTTDEEAVSEVWIAGFVTTLLEREPLVPDRALTGRAAQLSAALRTVAAGISLGAPPEDQRRATPPARHIVHKTSHRLRARPLAALLRLAGLLAFEARRLPEVLASHLAVSDPVVPREVLAVIRDAVWEIDREGDAPPYLHLDAVCPHPAIHAALASVAEDADELTHALRETASRLPGDESSLLRGLPARFTDHRLRPGQQHGLDAYDVPLTRFSLAQTEIRRLFMGEQLYDGRPTLALRELYQNALDACRYRQMRVRYLDSCGRNPAPWAGQIRIEAGEDRHGRYIECHDNGVGMTVDQLRNTFTRAGRRFDQSHSFRREQATWLRHDKSFRLYLNSRFGIGVFSYFMLADEMVVITRPVGPDGRPAERALRVEIPVSDSLFRVRDADESDGVVLPEGGTCVRLYLRDSSAFRRVSCVSVLRPLILISEFHLTVRDDDGQASVWPPGRLQPGDGGSEVAADSAVEAIPGVLWWVKGNGAIVCDGIAADTFPWGYVLNLSGEFAGKLTLNRNKLEHYDIRWAHQQIRQGAEALAQWPTLDLGWLRAIEARHPEIARILCSEWRGRHLRVAAGYGRTVDLDEVGWFKLDAALNSQRHQYGEEGLLHAAVRPWRSAALGDRYAGEREATPLSLEGHPVPYPGWSDIAEKIDGDWRNTVTFAAEHDMTVLEVLRATRGLRITHPRFGGPAVLRGGDLDWVPDDADLRIVRGLRGPERPRYNVEVTFGGQKRAAEKSPAEIYYRHAPGDLSGIVRTSARDRQTLGALAATCAKYTPFLPEPLPAIPDHHRTYICTDDDVALLYVQESAHTWRAVRTPWDIRAVAERTGRSPRSARRSIAAFSWLHPVPDPALVDRWAAVPPELFPLLRRYVRVTGGGHPVLPWAATIDLAAEWEIPVSKAERVLAKVARPLGLVHHRRYEKGSAGRREIPSPDVAELVGWLHGEGLLLENGVSLRDLAYVQPHKMSREELSWHLDELRALGVDVPDAAPLLRSWDDLPTPSRYAFSGVDPSFEAADYPVSATPAVLVTASQQLRQKLSFLWRTARQEARRLDLGDGMAPPKLPEELKAFSPTQDETAALVTYEWDDNTEWCESPQWSPLTPQRLVDYARARRIGVRTAFNALKPLRAIGALVPDLSVDAVAALPDDVPSARDAVAVDPAHRVTTAGSPLLPLDLVSIAGRLGEPMPHTWRRIAPYLCMEDQRPTVDHIPDLVPHWQDLAILSQGFDGKLPALSGSVSQDRLLVSAHAVGESPRWVRERLERYADMFGLAIAPVGENEETGQ
ncbi:caspase family protein [Streptomyces sp. NPDC057638]|uniref:HD domain-containing protein n=1 Tax=Streptomyces sp. NPDC057638 TaxID=3346190 RepID=UPI0036C4C193